MKSRAPGFFTYIAEVRKATESGNAMIHSRFGVWFIGSMLVSPAHPEFLRLLFTEGNEAKRYGESVNFLTVVNALLPDGKVPCRHGSQSLERIPLAGPRQHPTFKKRRLRGHMDSDSKFRFGAMAAPGG